MHVCIDYRPALHEGTGVGTYVRGLLTGLAQTFPQDRFSAFSASWKHRLAADATPEGVRPIDVRFPVRVLDRLWHRWSWPPVERWAGPVDVTHSPSPLPVPARSAARIVTVHDCYFLRHPEHVTGTVRRDYVPLVAASVRKADAVVVVSETTRDELREVLGLDDRRVHVTYNGVDPVFAPASTDDVTAMRGVFEIPSPYLLFVGRREPRKDLPTLLAALPAILDRFPEVELLLAGPDGDGWADTWVAAPAAARDKTRCIPHQTAATLARLYSGAEAVLLPSRWEGFGLTAVEAMACGSPVVASRAGALPEVLSDAAAWFAAGDAEALAAACIQVLEDTPHREALIAAGTQRAAAYTWERTARLTHDLYASLLA